MRSWDLNIFYRDNGNGDGLWHEGDADGFPEDGTGDGAGGDGVGGGGGEGLDLYRDQARAPPVFERPKCREEAGLCEEKAE